LINCKIGAIPRGGRFLGGVGIFEDIAERKLAEMERERLIKELIPFPRAMIESGV